MGYRVLVVMGLGFGGRERVNTPDPISPSRQGNLAEATLIAHRAPPRNRTRPLQPPPPPAMAHRSVSRHRWTLPCADRDRNSLPPCPAPKAMFKLPNASDEGVPACLCCAQQARPHRLVEAVGTLGGRDGPGKKLGPVPIQHRRALSDPQSKPRPGLTPPIPMANLARDPAAADHAGMQHDVLYPENFASVVQGRSPTKLA